VWIPHQVRNDIIFCYVFPAEAGIHYLSLPLDSRFHGNDTGDWGNTGSCGMTVVEEGSGIDRVGV
jgi:hypothetical protein